MSVTDFDEESNFLEIQEIHVHPPAHIKRLYVIIAIIVVTALVSFALGILAQKGSQTTAGQGNAVTSGSGSSAANSSLNSLSVPGS